MYLLICTIGNEDLKKPIEALVEKDENIIQATWLTGENIKKKAINEMPSIGGSIHSLFKNSEQEVLLARISEEHQMKALTGRMNIMSKEESAMDYFVIPLVS